MLRPAPPLLPPRRGQLVVTAVVHCGACSAGLGGWVGGRGCSSRSGAIFGRPPGSASAPAPGLMAPRPLSPLVLALGGAAAVLGSVLFILWKAYFGGRQEPRWDRSEGWWGVEPVRLPEWDEWDVSVGLG